MTHLPKDELAARRQYLEETLLLKEAAQVALEEDSGTASSDPRADWFSESMLSEQVFVHPPVEILPGRFFMFEGIFVSVVGRQHVGRSYGEIVGILRQLKWLGVTDIITHTGGPVANIRYLSELPDILYSPHARSYGFDYLEILLKAAHEVGLDVWGFWHPNTRGDVGEYQIRDPQGEAYAQYLDVKNPAALDLAKACIDELVDRYNVYGNFKGIFLDELWHPFLFDRMEGETERFAEFCREKFGEVPPADIDLAALFAKGRDWHDPDDVWWRRYVLFRNTFTVDYIREVTEYANSRGLLTMPQIGFGFNWFQGHGDTYNLARAGNILWSYELRNNTRYEQYPQDRVIYATHSRFPNGYQLACLLRGGWGSQFAMEQTWLPVTFARNPRAPEVLSRQIRANRTWFGARPLTRLAVLTDRLGLDLRFHKAESVFMANEDAVQRALGTVWPVAMLMTQDAEYYERYPVLVAPRYSLNFLSEREYDGLLSYVENGGNLVLLDGAVATARPDHTQVQDRTLELTGCQVGRDENIILNGPSALLFAGDEPPVMDAVFNTLELTPVQWIADETRVLVKTADGDLPVVTETLRGKGSVLTVHGDMAAWLQSPDNVEPAMALMQWIVEYADSSPLRIAGDLLTLSAVQKDNWVAVSLLSSDATYTARGGENYPASGRLYVDMPALGIKAERYRVYTLARDREIMPQFEDDLNLFGETYWTADMLAQDGIPVYIPPNSQQDLVLPYEGNDEYFRKHIMPRWERDPRGTAHEIIAIAPADEGSMVTP